MNYVTVVLTDNLKYENEQVTWISNELKIKKGELRREGCCWAIQNQNVAKMFCVNKTGSWVSIF